jgi:hypothetical protein
MVAIAVASVAVVRLAAIERLSRDQESRLFRETGDERRETEE